jgi:DNA invertase Pin-like site-specific DNA recombinase
MSRTNPKAPAKQQSTMAISYVRFSTRKQAQGDSQRRQTELAEAYCRRRGWKLSEQTFEDLGVSAFRGKNALVGNLGEFLKAVKSGAVPPGSVLIVESLDRISRQGIDEGYDLIKRILKAGVVLVTLTPEREFDAGATKSLSKGALEIQLILERAAEESERKSERIRAAWAGRRLKAREGRGTIVAGSLPAWIEKRDGKLRLIPERAAAVRRIFALAAAGYGRSRMLRALKQEKIRPLCGKEWASSSIGFILRDRRALGEYQPCKLGRVPDGEPIPNYYPAAVKEQEWLAARAGISQRRRNMKDGAKPWTAEEDELVRRLPAGTAARRTGRSRSAVFQRRHALGLTKSQRRSDGGNFVSVFTGLIQDALPPGANFIVVSRNDCGGQSKALLNCAHAEGKAPCRLFPLAVFERAILGALRELDPREILPRKEDPTRDEGALLRDSLAGIEAELAEASAFMEAHGFSATIGKRIAALEAKKADLAKQLLETKARAACPPEQAWRDYGSVLEALEQAPDPHDARVRLRSTLRRMVSSITLLVVRRSSDKLAAAQIHFIGGSRRDYLIWYRFAVANRHCDIPGSWRVRSLTSAEVAGIGLALVTREDEDLRDPTVAENIEHVLKALTRDDLDRLVFTGCPAHPL